MLILIDTYSLKTYVVVLNFEHKNWNDKDKFVATKVVDLPGAGLFRFSPRLAKTCQAQTNNELSTAKIDIFRGWRNVTGQSPLPPNV